MSEKTRRFHVVLLNGEVHEVTAFVMDIGEGKILKFIDAKGVLVAAFTMWDNCYAEQL